MDIPVRCYTCGRVVAKDWLAYNEELARRGPAARGAILTELGLRRYCCRRMLLTQPDVGDHMIRYNVPPAGAVQ